MEKLNQVNAVLRVCVNSVAEGRTVGLVYGMRLTEALVFSDMGSLLLAVEGVLDAQNFPQASQRIRSFAKRVTTYPDPFLPDAGMTAEAVENAGGTVCTFLLSVLSRRNATWQGSIDWLDGGEAEPFSSDLEFLKLAERHIFTFKQTKNSVHQPKS